MKTCLWKGAYTVENEYAFLCKSFKMTSKGFTWLDLFLYNIYLNCFVPCKDENDSKDCNRYGCFVSFKPFSLFNLLN